MKPPTPTTALSERWPGYNEQSWQERFAYLNELYREALSKMLAAPHPTKPQGEDITAKVERLRDATYFLGLRGASVRPDDALVTVRVGDLRAIEALSSQRAEGIEAAAKVAEDYAANCEKPYRELSVMPEVAANRYNNHKSAGLNIATAIRALKGTRLMDDMERGE